MTPPLPKTGATPTKFPARTPPPPPFAPAWLATPVGAVSSRPRGSPRKWVGDRIDAAVRWVLGAVETLGSVRESPALVELAEVVAAAQRPEQVESALVRLAGKMGGACRAELWLDRDETHRRETRLVARWTRTEVTMTIKEIEALGHPLALGLCFGDGRSMTIQLFADARGKGRWRPGLVRRLRALCDLTVAAERGLCQGRRGRVEPPSSSTAAVRDATFLNAVLPYALAQARRHREPLTLICVEIDRLGAVYRSQGPGVAGAAAMRVAEEIARDLRGSDVVARLDDDRLIVVLPNTGAPDAIGVAEKVRAVVKAVTPELTASLGVACFPNDASDMLSLLNAAAEAVATVKAQGGNRIAAVSLPPRIGLHDAHDADPNGTGKLLPRADGTGSAAQAS